MFTNRYYIKSASVCLRFLYVFMIKTLDLLNDFVVTLLTRTLKVKHLFIQICTVHDLKHIQYINIVYI